VLRQAVPGGEGVLSLLVQTPQQGGAAKQQEGGAHRGCQDHGDSPGRGRLPGKKGSLFSTGWNKGRIWEPNPPQKAL